MGEGLAIGVPRPRRCLVLGAATSSACPTIVGGAIEGGAIEGGAIVGGAISGCNFFSKLFFKTFFSKLFFKNENVKRAIANCAKY